LPLFINTLRASNAARRRSFKMPAQGGVSRTDHYRYSVLVRPICENDIPLMFTMIFSDSTTLGHKKRKQNAMSVLP
jgi:hypothetical protein